MKKQFEFCGEKIENLYIEEEMLDRLDMFMTTIRLMGYIAEGGIKGGVSYDRFHVEFTGHCYRVVVEMTAYGKVLDEVCVKVYGLIGKLGMHLVYIYKTHKELEDLYKILDDVLLYIE